MSKHAYLIMAHNEFNLLKRLVKLLDDPRNDIYVHVDKKTKSFTQDHFLKTPIHANLTFIERQKVTWGAFSQINCELSLLKSATSKQHDYYHLLSGADLPIKTQDEIHSFFLNHHGKEFIHVQHGSMLENDNVNRLRYYYILQEFIGNKRGRNLLYLINRGIIKIQEIMKVNRIKNSIFSYEKGDNWFSITHEFANYVVSQEKVIKKSFNLAKCADEIFIQTLVNNSHFKEKVYPRSFRYIDWKRGRPYTFRETDFDLLISSDAFWARKFSEKVDPIIIEKLFMHLT